MPRPPKESAGLSSEPNMIPKNRQSADISAKVREFLERGGKIQQIATGATGIIEVKSVYPVKGGVAKARNGSRLKREASYAAMLSRKKRVDSV